MAAVAALLPAPTQVTPTPPHSPASHAVSRRCGMGRAVPCLQFLTPSTLALPGERPDSRTPCASTLHVERREVRLALCSREGQVPIV